MIGQRENSPRETAESDEKHPGWQSLSELFNVSDPFFKNVLFLLSYEFSSNIYLFTGRELALIDPGNDYTAFMDLAKLGYRPSNIRQIAITHGHRDHCMGVFELLRAYPEIAVDGGFELILHEDSPPDLETAASQFGCRVTRVKGGETLSLAGYPWEIIHTPGHTIDSICFYHPPTKTVITGDTVLPDAMAEPDRNAGGNLQHYLFGLKAILRRDIECVLPGHGLPTVSLGRRIVEESYEGVMLKLLDVENPIRWIDGAKALVQQGLLEEAVYCCDKELARPSADLQALKLKGLCLNDLGRFQEALETFKELERADSSALGDAYVKIGRGYAHMGLGSYDESIRLFGEALTVRQGMQEALVYKGMALYLSGRPEEALEIEAFQKEFVGRFKDQLEQRR